MEVTSNIAKAKELGAERGHAYIFACALSEDFRAVEN